MKHHAGEAHAAGPAVVEGLLVLEQAALGRARSRAASCRSRRDRRRDSGCPRPRPSETSRRDRRPLPVRASDRQTIAPDPEAPDRPASSRQTQARRGTGRSLRYTRLACRSTTRRPAAPRRNDSHRGRRSDRPHAPSSRETTRPGSARSKTRAVRPADTAGRRPETRSNARSDATARRRKSRGPSATRCDRRTTDPSAPGPAACRSPCDVSTNRRRQY